MRKKKSPAGLHDSQGLFCILSIFSNLSKKRLDLFLHHRDGFGSELNYYVIQNNHNLLPF